MWLILLATALACAVAQSQVTNYGVKGVPYVSQAMQDGTNIFEYVRSHGKYRYASPNYNVPWTEVGVCYTEVPTTSLAGDPIQTEVTGVSRPGLSRVRSCCRGYIQNIYNPMMCEPICSQDCINSLCTAPETCTCFPDYVRNSGGICVPTCPVGCQNGYCSGVQCVCKEGFRLDFNRKYCVPICRDDCGVNGNCTAPNVCACKAGYTLLPGGGCSATQNILQNPYISRPLNTSTPSSYYNNPYNPGSQRPYNSVNPSSSPYLNNSDSQYNPSGSTSFSNFRVGAQVSNATSPTYYYEKNESNQSFGSYNQQVNASRNIYPNLSYFNTTSGIQNKYGSGPPVYQPTTPSYYYDNQIYSNSGGVNNPSANHTSYSRFGSSVSNPNSPTLNSSYYIYSENRTIPPPLIVYPIATPSNTYTYPTTSGNYTLNPNINNQPGNSISQPIYNSSVPYIPAHRYRSSHPVHPPYNPSYPTNNHLNPNINNQPGNSISQPVNNSSVPYVPAHRYRSSHPVHPPYNPSYPTNNHLNPNFNNHPGNSIAQPIYNSSVPYLPTPRYPTNQPVERPYNPNYPTTNPFGPPINPYYPSPGNQPGYIPPGYYYPGQYVQPGYYPGQYTNYPNQFYQPNAYSSQISRPYITEELHNNQNRDVELVQQCPKSCLNGDCVGNQCHCHNGYVLDETDPTRSRCLPFCPGGCQNGVCSAPNLCICNFGYQKEAGVKGQGEACVRMIRSAGSSNY